MKKKKENEKKISILPFNALVAADFFFFISVFTTIFNDCSSLQRPFSMALKERLLFSSMLLSNGVRSIIES